MIKVLIVDDEVRARNILQYYLNTLIPEITEIRVASSVAEARGMLELYDPQIVFLDIEMPYQTGFDLLKTGETPSFDIIFTTAYNQYAIRAIRFSALDYLLKPIDPDDLINAIKRYFLRKEALIQKKELLDNLASNIEKKETKDMRLAVPSSEGIFFFNTSEIIRLEADRNYTIIHFKDRRPFVASKTLKYFEEILVPFKFIRTHKSHLINPEYIIRISNNNEFIILCDGSKVEVSRRKKEEVQQHLNIK